MTTWDELQRLTIEHMADPQTGDVFHEMYNYWIRVIGRDRDAITTKEGVGDKQVNKHYLSIEAFQSAFRYSTNSNYYVQFYPQQEQEGK